MRQEIASEIGPRKYANEQQVRFINSRAPELLYSGAFGAGKSRILCEKAYYLGRTYPNTPIGIFRKARASLAATTRVTFLRDVVPQGDIVRKNVTEGWYELGNGSRFWLLGLDADPVTGVPSKVGSLDLAFAFVDEAIELDEADWMMLLGRLRWPEVPYTQLAAATNPAGPDHWLKRRFTPGTAEREYLQASTLDNRLTTAEYQRRMAGLSGIYRERYVRGEWINVDGGLFDPTWVRLATPPQTISEGKQTHLLTRIVVAVDPAVTAEKGSDETGIIVAGVDPAGQGHVLADLSGRMAPHVWAERVVQAYHEFKADRIVAEVNNGGDLVERTIRGFDNNVAYSSVTASRGKIVRAEPVANLYGMGKVSHVADFPELVSQMVSYDGKGKSPDRMDALVWALTDLMLTGYTGDAEQSWIA